MRMASLELQTLTWYKASDGERERERQRERVRERERERRGWVAKWATADTI